MLAVTTLGARAEGAPPIPGRPTPTPNATPTPTPTPNATATANANATATATANANANANATPTPLKSFDAAFEFEPRNPADLVTFSLEDADLPQLTRAIAQLTGKRFLFGAKIRDIKATVYSPQKITVAEAYQAFLSILETNGLTAVPHGRFLQIVETPGIATQGTPIYGAGQATPREDRFVTRIQRLQHAGADDIAALLGHFKSKDGDIVAYAPGNLLILTDTGENIRRMMGLLLDVDVGRSSEKVWIEPIHYASAADVVSRLEDVFDARGDRGGAAATGKAGVPSDVHFSKILDDPRSNSVILVGTESAYLRALELIKRLDAPVTGEGEIRVIPLQHADATELTKTVNEIVTGAASGAAAPAGGATKGAPMTAGIFEGRIKASADKATNSLVVTASPRDFAALRSVVDRLDLPRRQVFIEAVIMDLTVDHSSTFGSNFHAGAAPTFGNAGQGLVYGGLNPLTTIGLPDPTALQGAALGIRGPGIPGSDTLLGTGITIPAFGVLVSALAHSEDTDVLTTPHILATDNVPAEINVGQNIPLQTNVGAGLSFPTTGATGATSALGGLGGAGLGGGFAAPRQDVGTKIKVTPHLNDSNEVRLELTEEISEASATPVGALGTISLVKRTAQTTMTVRDQQTVVIGGLLRNRTSHSEDKIPLLGDIPVLGALFRQSTTDNQKANLILVLTPYIIREQDDLRTIFERKMQERQEFLDRYFVFSEDQQYSARHDFGRSTGLLEDIRQRYLHVEEEKALEQLKKPKDVLGHEPSEPLAQPRPGERPASK